MGGAASRAAYDSPPTLSAKLGSKQHCMMAFLSPTCGLCASLRPKLSQLESEAAGWLTVARLDATYDTVWAPEMLRYDVETVPCLVLLRPDGRAVCKSGPPTTLAQMTADLEDMLGSVQR